MVFPTLNKFFLFLFFLLYFSSFCSLACLGLILFLYLSLWIRVLHLLCISDTEFFIFLLRLFFLYRSTLQIPGSSLYFSCLTWAYFCSILWLLLHTYSYTHSFLIFLLLLAFSLSHELLSPTLVLPCHPPLLSLFLLCIAYTAFLLSLKSVSLFLSHTYIHMHT